MTSKVSTHGIFCFLPNANPPILKNNNSLQEPYLIRGISCKCVKNRYFYGNENSFFFSHSLCEKVTSQQTSQKSNNETKMSLKFIVSYRKRSISLSLCVMKLFSSTVFTLTNAAPYPWKKPKKSEYQSQHCVIDLSFIDRCILFQSYDHS